MIDLNKNSNSEPTQQEFQEYVDRVYDYAADLVVNKGMSYEDAQRSLISQGVDPSGAKTVISNIKREIDKAKKEAAGKDIMWGLVWAGGGILLTLITGGQFIFWGAVVYGGYRLIHGLINQ